MTWSSARTAVLARELGRQLHDALPAAVTQPFAVDSVPVEQTSRQSCVWIPANREPELPWELVVGEGEDRTAWGLESRVGIAYRTRWNDPLLPEVSLPGPLSIVVASCMPVGIPSANVDAQRVALAHTVSGFPPAWATHHRWYENPTFDTLRAALSDGTTLLHVLAHGRPGEILWHENGAPHWLAADAYCRQLAGTSVALVSFCVCDSAARRDRSAPSLAEAACRNFARSSVGMRGLLADTPATAYLQGLLRPLESGSARVDRMASEARRQIARDGHSLHWPRPVLFVRDGMLRLQLAPPRQTYPPDSAITPMRSRFLVLDGEPIRLSERPVSVGRSAAADIVVSGAQVAPFQIVVDTSVEPAEVRDQTGQGVLVNGHRVARWTLANGDELSFASTRLTYESEAVNGG
jgi:hypothetical protein